MEISIGFCTQILSTKTNLKNRIPITYSKYFAVGWIFGCLFFPLLHPSVTLFGSTLSFSYFESCRRECNIRGALSALSYGNFLSKVACTFYTSINELIFKGIFCCKKAHDRIFQCKQVWSMRAYFCETTDFLFFLIFSQRFLKQ